MNKKITQQDIIESLIQKHSMERKDAEAFVKGMFELIEETLASEKLVKIKGLGTFKLIDVDSRESINVNSGERFKIEGHSKVSFIPDATLKNIINKPFSHFETVILNDSTNLEDTDVVIENPSEINSDESSEDLQNNPNESDETLDSNNISVEIVEEEVDKPEAIDFTAQAPAEEPTTEDNPVQEGKEEENIEIAETTTNEEAEETETVETAQEEVVLVEDTPVKEEIIAANIESEEEPSPEVVSDEKEENPTAEETNDEERITVDTENPEEKEVAAENSESDDDKAVVIEENKNKNKSMSIMLNIGIVAVIAFACLLFYLLSDYSSNTSNEQQPQVIDTTQVIKENKDTIPDSTAQAIDSVKVENLKQNVTDTKSNEVDNKAAASTKTEVSKVEASKVEKNSNTAQSKTASTKAYDENLKYTTAGTKTVHVLQEGETIIKLSLKYYGTKKLYPYILEYNKAEIGENGDKVKYGKKIKIPELKPVK